MVDRREFPFADVTLSRVFSFRNRLAVGEKLGRFRRIDVRRRDEHWLAAQFADAGCREDILRALHLLDPLFPFDDLQQLAAAERVRARDTAGGIQQPVAISLWDVGEQGTIGDNRLEQVRGCAQALIERSAGGFRRNRTRGCGCLVHALNLSTRLAESIELHRFGALV